MSNESSHSIFGVIGSFFWELVKIFLVAIVIIVPVRYFLVQPFIVRGASMEPNFEHSDYLVIDELSYRWREPRRGEVIVFRFPDNPSQFFIKRVIGVPHDKISVEQGRVVVHNSQLEQGAVIDESDYLTSGTRTGGDVTIELGDEEYFVLGDNRAASSDSRSWGVLPKDQIVGRVWIRAFPFDRIDVFEPSRPGFVSL